MTYRLTRKQERQLQRCYRCGAPLWTDNTSGERYCSNPRCDKYVSPKER